MHHAQPLGAKLNGKMRISATNGSAMLGPHENRGKMPNSEMMKLMQRYGWKFVCGWLPPMGVIAAGASAAVAVSSM